LIGKIDQIAVIVKKNAPYSAESLKIKETPDGKPAYVVLEAEA